MLLDILFSKCGENIVIVVTPFNSIIEDQINDLRMHGVSAGVLNFNLPHKKIIPQIVIQWNLKKMKKLILLISYFKS